MIFERKWKTNGENNIQLNIQILIVMSKCEK
jgi:hypothetical protein